MHYTRLLQNACLRFTRIGQLHAATTAVNILRYATTKSATNNWIQPPPHGLAAANYATAAVHRAKRTATQTKSGSATKPAPTVEQLWSFLETYYQQNGLLHYEQCLRLLEQLEASSLAIDANELLNGSKLHFLLGSCVPEVLPAQKASERLQLFQRLWAQLHRRQQPTLKHYETQLKMLEQNRLPLHDHRALLNDIAVFHGEADATLYSLLLDVACASGNMRQASELLSEMRAHNFALSERNFHALLLGHARNVDLAGVDTTLSSMRAAGMALNASTQALRIVAYAENSQPDKARELLQTHADSFNEPQLLQILRSTVRAENVDLELLQQVVRQLPKDYVSSLDVPTALRNLCIELLHNERLNVMSQLVAALPAPKYNEKQNVDSYGELLLQELFRARVPLNHTLNFARDLRQRGQNTRALHLVTELALRRQPAVALNCFEALIEAGEQLRPHYFWPLLLHQRQREGEAGLLRVLSDMQRLRVECDEETLRHYVLPKLYQLLQQPQEALKQLDACGVRCSHVLPDVLTQLLQQQQMTQALELLQLYPTRLDLSNLLQPLSSVAVHARATKRYQQFAQLVQALQQHALQRAEDFVGALLLQMCAPQSRLRQNAKALQNFVHELGRLGLQVSPAAAETLISIAKQANAEQQTIDDLGKTLHSMRNAKLTLTADPNGSTSNGPTGNTSFIKHPRDMTLDEMECHLIELEAKQLNTRGLLRRLLQASVRGGRLERALQIKAKCNELNVQTSPGMLAAIFDLHIKLKDVKQAEQTLQKMQLEYPGFQVDEHKFIDYAALLVEAKQLDVAKQLLEQRAAQHKITGGNYVIKNVWQLLTNVAQLSATSSTETDENLTAKTYEFLKKLGYCRTHNAVLGPIVREWLLRGNIAQAVSEFQRLAAQHKHTPLQFELLSLLVRLSNADEQELANFKGCSAQEAQKHLAAVTATVSRIHGPANMNSALLLALAESGTETQLRRLVINPEFRMNHDLLLQNCEHLGQEGAVRTLLRLARGVRGLQRIVDEQRIYDMLLAQFAKNQNYEAALDLFTRLEADDELKISQEFLRNLVKLLQMNNVDIPSNIALRAQII